MTYIQLVATVSILYMKKISNYMGSNIHLFLTSQPQAHLDKFELKIAVLALEKNFHKFLLTKHGNSETIAISTKI